MIVERAFAPTNRPKSDRHVRVAFKQKSRMLDRENIFSRRTIPGTNTMQTPDAKNSSTIAIKLWHIRPCESYRCSSFPELTSTPWAQPMRLRDYAWHRRDYSIAVGGTESSIRRKHQSILERVARPDGI